MQIKELLEKLNEFLDDVDKLYEHAAGKSDVLQDIKDKSDTTVEHIIKSIQYGSQHPDTVHHWAGEIYAALAKVVYRKFKRSKRSANREELKQNLLLDKYDVIEAIEGANYTAKMADKYNADGYKNPKYTDTNELQKVLYITMDNLIDLIIKKEFYVPQITKVLQDAAGV